MNVAQRELFFALSFSLACRNVEPQIQKDPPMRLSEESNQREPTGDANVVAVTYGRGFDRFGSMALSVQRDGTGYLRRNFTHAGPNEIGEWQGPLGQNVFAEWLRRLRASNYRSIDRPSVWVPGSGGVDLGERREGKPSTDTLCFRSDQPELAEVFAYIEGVTAKLREHPKRVLRAEAHWRTVSLTRGGVGEIDYTLSNPGVEPLQTSNPAYAQADGLTGLRLTGQGLSLDMKAANVRATAGAAAGPSLHLRPGESASFVLSVNVPLGPGRHDTRLHSDRRLEASPSSTGDDSAPADAVGGLMFIELGEISIPR